METLSGIFSGKLSAVVKEPKIDMITGAEKKIDISVVKKGESFSFNNKGSVKILGRDDSVSLLKFSGKNLFKSNGEVNLLKTTGQNPFKSGINIMGTGKNPFKSGINIMGHGHAQLTSGINVLGFNTMGPKTNHISFGSRINVLGFNSPMLHRGVNPFKSGINISNRGVKMPNILGREPSMNMMKPTGKNLLLTSSSLKGGISAMEARMKPSYRLSGVDNQAQWRINQQSGLPAFGDYDRDGVPNILDCQPRNRYRQDSAPDQVGGLETYGGESGNTEIPRVSSTSADVEKVGTMDVYSNEAPSYTSEDRSSASFVDEGKSATYSTDDVARGIKKGSKKIINYVKNIGEKNIGNYEIYSAQPGYTQEQALENIKTAGKWTKKGVTNVLKSTGLIRGAEELDEQGNTKYTQGAPIYETKTIPGGYMKDKQGKPIPIIGADNKPTGEYFKEPDTTQKYITGYERGAPIMKQTIGSRFSKASGQLIKGTLDTLSGEQARQAEARQLLIGSFYAIPNTGAGKKEREEFLKGLSPELQKSIREASTSQRIKGTSMVKGLEEIGKAKTYSQFSSSRRQAYKGFLGDNPIMSQRIAAGLTKSVRPLGMSGVQTVDTYSAYGNIGGGLPRPSLMGSGGAYGQDVQTAKSMFSLQTAMSQAPTLMPGMNVFGSSEQSYAQPQYEAPTQRSVDMPRPQPRAQAVNRITAPGKVWSPLSGREVGYIRVKKDGTMGYNTSGRYARQPQ